jgi:hypothetical protein
MVVSSDIERADLDPLLRLLGLRLLVFERKGEGDFVFGVGHVFS